jgi:hypothetical protein
VSLESQQSKRSSSNRVIVVIVIHLYLKPPCDDSTLFLSSPGANQRMKKRAMLFEISHCLPIQNIEICRNFVEITNDELKLKKRPIEGTKSGAD